MFVMVVFFTAHVQTSAQPFSCPTYSAQNAASVVRAVYMKVLEREADDSGLVTYAGKISGGGWCLRQIVRDLGLSPEYAERFIKNQTPRQAIVLMYRHFLLREPENEQVINQHVNDLNFTGWKKKVVNFVSSAEAEKIWAEFSPLKGNTSAGLTSSSPPAGCKFFLGRSSSLICPSLPSFNQCETLRKGNQEGVKECRIAGVDSAVDASLVTQGCSRTGVGEYMCMVQKAFDSCEIQKKNNKVKLCKRTPIKTGGNK